MTMAENEVYEVEQILDQREVEGQLQFFVKWKNFTEEWNSWEPIDNLLECFDLVLEFQENHQKQKSQVNVSKSELARKEALKLVKKAKKVNTTENLKEALQKHAEIIVKTEIPSNFHIPLSVETKSLNSCSQKSPKSHKKSLSNSPKSVKSTGNKIKQVNSAVKRTPKKPTKLEEYFDSSKLFTKSTSVKSLIVKQTPSSKNSHENAGVLRTLLTSPVIKIPNQVGTIIETENGSLKISGTKTESEKNAGQKSTAGKTGLQKKSIVKAEIKSKPKNILKKSVGVKSLKTSEKTLKKNKTGCKLVVKVKPLVKKTKKDQAPNKLKQSFTGDISFGESESKVVEQNVQSSVSPKLENVKLIKEKNFVKKKIIVKKENGATSIKKDAKKTVQKKQENKSQESKEKVKTIKKCQTEGEKKVKTKSKEKIKENKESNKGGKRKLEDSIEIIDTESDDDIETRYSVSPKTKKQKTENSPKQTDSSYVKKINLTSKLEKELSKKTLQVKVKPMETSHIKKMRLIDTVKTGISKPVVRPVSPTPVFTSVKPMMSTAKQSIPMETFCGDVPGYFVPAMIPISPSSMSYKMMFERLPFQFQTKKSSKRQEDDYSRNDDVERRMSVRQSECAYKYKEIIVKKCNRYTQIWLNSQTHHKLKNSLNPQVIQEVVSALNSAKYDDSNLVLFSGLGNVFCSGIDLTYLVSGDRKIAARKMVDALRDFMKAIITFPKPLIAVVTGSAIGLGMTMLPLCDIVYASDKATFHLPYSQLSQTPEGCASFMLPTTVGMAMANELLIGGRKITAIEACQLGLVSQVFWPTSIMQEVIPRIENMAQQSGKALETTKLLIRSHQRTKIELTNESECNLLLERWPSMECQKSIENYLSNDNNFSI